MEAALLKGFIKIHDEMGFFDEEFIKSSTVGIESMLEKARAVSWNTIEADSGLRVKYPPSWRSYCTVETQLLAGQWGLHSNERCISHTKW